ncbi:AMP-binding protein [Arachnia propionica]|jgi:AMP-dependent synthetase/ligase|uniref:2-succinylbenzoate--CoA ligase n=1 Tax=Arachnia propionica TaxID=1750 RepID=A0A448N0V7_9ACTN|nr:AMP-binding protein [Arachnia propionica]VEH71036.1 2-succinylbenzoate--CoA ligase [Arachnia propionica]
MNTDVSRMLDGGPALWLADGPAPRLPRGVGAVVQTSGTTGSARRVVLSREALRAAARAARERVGGDLTWHLALPGRYVAGLMVQVRSAVAGRRAPVVPTDLEGLAPTGDGDAISLVPTQLHRALGDAAVTQRLRAFDLILLGGAPLGAGLRERAGDAGLAVVESYGMSETSGGVVWDGKPLPGVWIGLCDGRVSIGGPTLFDGYLDDPAATAEAMEEGTLLTHDRGRWEGGRLVITGRVDDVVISGGVNVDLAEVRAAAARIDPETAVLAVPDAEWGTRVVLFAPGGDLAGWREALAGALPRTWLPRQLVGTPIPRTPGGKPDREALSGLIAGENH